MRELVRCAALIFPHRWTPRRRMKVEDKPLTMPPVEKDAGALAT